jgi:hypothetical protein
MIIKEYWKDIPGFESRYIVSSFGNVASIIFTKRILKQHKHVKGYLKVRLMKDRVYYDFFVHRLVMHAFIGESDLQVNHKNGIKTDNNIKNLEYNTASENLKHAFKIGLKSHKLSKHPKRKMVMHLETGIFYDSLKEGTNAFNLNYHTESHRVAGVRKNPKFIYI